MRYFIYSALILVLTACSSSECALLPCPAPFAVSLQLTSAATGGAVNGTVEVTGATQSNLQCAGACSVPGGGGTYHIKVTAAGYKIATHDVSVTETRHECGCPMVATASVVMKLEAL